MKDNIVTIIIVILIILVIIITCGFVFFMTKDTKKDDNQELSETSTNNFENKTINTDINDKEEEKTNNNSEGNGKKPNGIAMRLSFPKVEQSPMTTNNGEVMIDKILMDDCVFTISDKLNKNGYEMELTNDDKVLSITSKDGLYSCKIARFSSINPFELTEDQEKKLADIYDKLSDEAYEKINVSKDDENYYDVFFEQYDKEKENSKELADFYDDNNINRFTSFDGFTEREMKENVWGLLDINTDELEWIMENKSWYRNLLYKTSDSDVHLCELSKEKLPFAGIFVIMETYEGDYDNNEVDFWIF